MYPAAFTAYPPGLGKSANLVSHKYRAQEHTVKERLGEMTPQSRRYGFEPEKFIPYLKRLMEERDETSYRQTALDAGLDRSAVWRFVEKGTRPHRDACILLGQHFRVNPNEVLEAAGYDPIPIFDLSLIDPDEFSPEVKAVARALSGIEDADRRRAACRAVRVLIEMANRH